MRRPPRKAENVTTRQKAVKAKPLDPRTAFFFSLFGGPLGQVYCGRLRRGIVLWPATVFISTAIISTAAMLPLGRIGFALLFLAAIVTSPGLLCVDAFLLAKRCRSNPRKRYQRWWFYWLFFSGVYIINAGWLLGFKAFVAETFLMTTSAMSPTLQPGDRMLVDKLWYSPRYLRTYDLVVFHKTGPKSPALIFRVVALPGDEIEIKDEVVFVNGIELEEKYANLSGELPHPKAANYGPATVPLDSFFVMGDNRRLAFDSRFIGPVPLSDLMGRANVILWSRERHYPDKWNISQYVDGRIVWSRFGMPLQ